MTTETNQPRQLEKKKPFSKLFRWVSLPENQFKVATPQDTELEEQEAFDYSVPQPQQANIASPEFIHDNQSIEDDIRDTEFLQLNREQKPNSPFIHFMDGKGCIWNRPDMYNLNPAANLTDSATSTDTIPLSNHLLQQLVNFPQATNADGTMTGGATGGMTQAMTRNTTENMTINMTRNTTESNFDHAGGSGFSPPPQERVPMNADYTEYRDPAIIPVLQDLSLPPIHQTPQAAELTNALENTASQTRGSIFFSSITQQPPAGHMVSLPIPHNVTAQNAPH